MAQNNQKIQRDCKKTRQIRLTVNEILNTLTGNQ